MVNPVPGYFVTTAFGAKGSHWASCGWHTGQDYAAPHGAPVVAARAGSVVHVDYGSAFGGHQFAVRPGDGTEDFYAHCGSRPAHGAKVDAGQQVAVVGAEGNATGPHLHLERHTSYGWSCSAMADPMASHDDDGTGTAPPQQATHIEEDDMIIINSPGRQAALVGAGYAKELTDEEYNVLKDLGVREAEHNDRGFDVARAACLYGDATD